MAATDTYVFFDSFCYTNNKLNLQISGFEKKTLKKQLKACSNKNHVSRPNMITQWEK